MAFLILVEGPLNLTENFMATSRRKFIRNAGLAGAVGITYPIAGRAGFMGMQEPNKKRPETLFFDVNETLLDLTPLKKSVEDALHGKSELIPLWFTTMLQYSLVATAGNQYQDFGEIGAATLVMVAANNDIKLSMAKAKKAIAPIRSLPPHPEVKEALSLLRNDGYQMVSFTNSSNEAIADQLQNAGIDVLFEERLSIEDIGKYKPHADTYSWAARKMGRSPQECMLMAAHGWDIAGALWAGWRGAFIARPGQQLYPPAVEPEFIGPNLKVISEKLLALKK